MYSFGKITLRNDEACVECCSYKFKMAGIMIFFVLQNVI